MPRFYGKFGIGVQSALVLRPGDRSDLWSALDCSTGIGDHLEMRNLSRLVVLQLLVCLLASAQLGLAQTDLGDGPELDRDDGYLPLETHFGSVLYPPSYLDRASRLMDRVERTGVELYIWSKNAVKVDILVHDLAGWQKRYPDHLYGLPARIDPTTIAIAAGGTPGTVRIWEMLLGRPVPPAPGLPILGTPEQAMTLIYCDLLLQLELGQIFAEQAGYGSGEEQWPVHVIAHLTAVEFLSRHDVGQLQLFDDLMAAWGSDATPRALVDDMRSQPISTQLWYQARFRDAAALIRAHDQSHSISRIQRKMRKMQKREEGEPADVLIDLYPELSTWLETSFAEPPAAN